MRSGHDAALDSRAPTLRGTIAKFIDKNFFQVGVCVAVLSAKFFPFLGVDGGVTRPELFLGKYGVGLIFLLSGLSLPTSELTRALSNMKLNALVQLSIFALWPLLIGIPLKTLFSKLPSTVMLPALVDGILILTCLPTTVNMCIMLTSTSGGNVATSICNAVLSNLAGIFITPALLFQFFGTQIRLPFVHMVMKLCQKVLLPVLIGQGLRATKVKAFYSANARVFKRLQEVILLGIAWNAFCNAFSSGLALDLRQSILLLTLLPLLHLLSLGGLFQLFSLPSLGFSRGETIAAMFCSSHKTLAFGLPLINTIFEGNANLAAYCAPVMFIHPLQMTLGSLLMPSIVKYTSGETESKSPENTT